ncbi:MAG: 50S ribosomal protein L24 [Christensenellales bacterium]|jgi:large subunit ribosomal protein L24
MHVKKNDIVMVISGKDAGKRGKVLMALPAEGKVVVEGVNMIVRHVKPRSAQQQGGRVTQEGPLYASKVMLVCPKCQKPTRVARRILESGKTRMCKRCGETID